MSTQELIDFFKQKYLPNAQYFLQHEYIERNIGFANVHYAIQNCPSIVKHPYFYFGDLTVSMGGTALGESSQSGQYFGGSLMQLAFPNFMMDDPVTLFHTHIRANYHTEDEIQFNSGFYKSIAFFDWRIQAGDVIGNASLHFNGWKVSIIV